MNNQIKKEDIKMITELKVYLNEVRIPYLGEERHIFRVFQDQIDWNNSPNKVLNNLERKYLIENNRPITGSTIETIMEGIENKYLVYSSIFDKIKNVSSPFTNVFKSHIFIISVAFILTEEDKAKLLEAFHIDLYPKYYTEDAIFEFFTKKYKYSLDNIEGCQFDLKTHKNVINKYIKCLEYGKYYVDEQKKFKINNK